VRGGDARIRRRQRVRELALQTRDLASQVGPRGGFGQRRRDGQHAFERTPRIGLVKPYPWSVPRNDPTDTGGLFIGRRPGTGPVHYRGEPERGSAARRRTDGLLAGVVLVIEALLCLSVWGPQPLAWLWIGSQADYATGSTFLGIAVAFAGILASLFITLAICTRLDRVWRLLRRAAGHEQREGVLPRIFGATAVIALVLFAGWFLILEGPAPSLAPR
jgi:hypothetical protein